MAEARKYKVPVQRLLDAWKVGRLNLDYGASLTRSELEAHAELKGWRERATEMPGSDEAAKGIAAKDAANLEWLSTMKGLKDVLLLEHKRLLKHIGKGNYVVVQPGDQTAIVVQDRTRKIRNQLLHMQKELENVNTGLMTDAERAENAMAIAKTAAIRGIASQRLFREKRKLERK